MDNASHDGGAALQFVPSGSAAGSNPSALTMNARRHGLFGRQRETEALERLLETARAGESGATVLLGPAGIGKSALIDYLVERAVGFRIERAVGVESELELAYAGLHQLCLPMLDRVDQLPAPQRSALTTAFGLSAGSPPDRFFVGLAVLSLLSAVAEDRPLLAIIDDAQWVDELSLQVLAFVARRLRAESVALVFAVRSDARQDLLSGVPELPLPGLQDADAHALLDAVLVGRVDAAVRDQIVADSRGCPLALLELSRALTLAELAGGFGLPRAVPLLTSLEETYMSRLRGVAPETRRLIHVAALEPIGDVATVWRAAESLGIGRDAADAAKSSGLVEFDSRVRFRHPLVRSAICRMEDAGATRDAHAALAAATDPNRHADRRAWHRALAADGPDESVASELERCAGRAQDRGGLAAAAAFLKATVGLTADPNRRRTRAITAAQAEYQAGASDEALALLAVAEAGPPDDLDAARAELLRGQVAFSSGNIREAPALLMAAAQRWQALDPRLAGEAYLDALSAGLVAGRYAVATGLLEVARAVRASPRGGTGATDLLLAGFATLVTDGYGVGAPLLKNAITAFRNERLLDPAALRWLWLAQQAATAVWDHESWAIFADRHIALARGSGALGALPIALTSRAELHLAAGELEAAGLLVEEVSAVTAATGQTPLAYGRIGLAAWQGREDLFMDLAPSTAAAAADRGDGLGAAMVSYSSAVVHNSRGHYRKALAQAESGVANIHDLTYAPWLLTELVEAASRTGESARAAAALERLAETTQASGSDWALGIEARSRALLSADSAAEPLYLEAISRLSSTRVLMELARTHLLYGEWQRRTGRRAHARENLRTAHEMFSGFGATAFADRARRELLATGETVRKRTAVSSYDLTAQELQIATLAAAGRTNLEIGAELFISSRTVEWHLAKVYPKLGIASRKELRGAIERQRRSFASQHRLEPAQSLPPAAEASGWS